MMNCFHGTASLGDVVLTAMCPIRFRSASFTDGCSEGWLRYQAANHSAHSTPGMAYHTNIHRQPHVTTSHAVNGDAMMLPTDMKPLNAPEVDACAVRENHRDMTIAPTGTKPACATPMKAREPIITQKCPDAIPAVARDQSTAYRDNAR